MDGELRVFVMENLAYYSIIPFVHFLSFHYSIATICSGTVNGRHTIFDIPINNE